MGAWNEPIDLGVLEFYWLAIFQPKGFLKVLEFIIAILTFSLTAGFFATATQDCFSNGTLTNTVASYYPFNSFLYHSFNNTSIPLNSGIGNTAQFFVAWGVFTMFYCIAAVVVYMTLSKKFVVSGLTSLPDWLVLIDLGATVFWIFMWFVAFLAWAVESHFLRSGIPNVFDVFQFCPNVTNATVSVKTFAQVDISLTFSFLLIFVWICNIYFVLKDTKYYISWNERRKQNYAPPAGAASETY